MSTPDLTDRVQGGRVWIALHLTEGIGEYELARRLGITTAELRVLIATGASRQVIGNGNRLTAERLSEAFDRAFPGLYFMRALDAGSLLLLQESLHVCVVER